MNIPEPTTVHPLAEDVTEHLAVLGKTSGIYAFVSSHKITHLGWSTNLSRRLRRLLRSREGEPTTLAQRLQNTATTVAYWPTGSRLESAIWLYQLAKSHFGEDYLERLRLRLPWFVALTDIAHFPRLVVLHHLREQGTPVIGPFRSRDAAQRYQEELLGCFLLRRCTEELVPHPQHPGCIYGEMRLCLRPCQGISDEQEYRQEAQQAADVLLQNGQHLLPMLCAARNQAASSTDFETAAQLHKRIEKLTATLKSKDEIIGDLQRCSGVAVTRGWQQDQYRLWPLVASYWQEPVTVQFSANDQASTAAFRIRESLAPAFEEPARAGVLEEDLAVFVRWYHSSWRDGEWIPCAYPDAPACRKVVRSMARMAKESATPEEASRVLG